MCNQVPSVTLQTAVLMQAKEFADNNQQFSVHDITRTLRLKTGQGELEIPEVETTGASFRFDIPHVKVKALFDELWRTGVFDPDFTLSRQFNGVYFEYTPSAVNQSANAGVSVNPTPTPQTAPPAPVNNVEDRIKTYPQRPRPAWLACAPVNNVEDRIKTYLSNCAIRNLRPTLRRVQSAIKRNDTIPIPSCEELKDCIENVLGYVVVTDPDSISMSQVDVA